MQTKKGRASYLGERSVGDQASPGATSSYLMLQSLLTTLAGSYE